MTRKRIGLKRQSGNARGTPKARPPRQPPPAKRMERAGETEPADVLGHPKEPQRRSPVNDTKATATPLRPAQTEANERRDKRRSDRPQPHRQTTARTHRSEQSLPAKRTAPGHANRQRPNTKRQQTHGRSDQTEDAKAEHKRTTKATGEAAPTHAGTRTKQHGGHPARQNQRQRRQTHRPRDRQRTKAATDTAAGKLARHQNNHATRTTNPGKPRLTDKQRRQAKPTPPGHKSTKNTEQAKRPKNKSKTDGSWRQAIEREKVASPETTVRARSTRTTDRRGAMRMRSGGDKEGITGT